MPRVAMASISSVTRMTPICAVIAAPGAAREQDRDHQRTEFTNDRHAKQVDDINICAVGLEGVGRQIGQDHADEKTDQRGNRHRQRARLEDGCRNLAPGKVTGMQDAPDHIQHQGAEQAEQSPGVAQQLKFLSPEGDEQTQQIFPPARWGIPGNPRDPLEDGFMFRAKQAAIAAFVTPGPPDQYRPGAVQRFHRSQIPKQAGVLRCRLEAFPDLRQIVAKAGQGPVAGEGDDALTAFASLKLDGVGRHDVSLQERPCGCRHSSSGRSSANLRGLYGLGVKPLNNQQVIPL